MDVPDAAGYLAAMIMPSDDDYTKTKRLKIDGTPLVSPFKELAEWIGAHYEVRVLNVILDTIEPHRRPRLNVVLEWEQEARDFKDRQFVNFDATRQDAVGQEFASLADEVLSRKFDLNKLLVIFTSFESVARIEANGRVTEDEIKRLKKSLNDGDLWKIRPRFAGVTFFFYTDAQLKSRDLVGTQDRFERAYAELVAPHDEFGYLATRGVTVELDSKENFDSVYKGNWFYYDK